MWCQCPVSLPSPSLAGCGGSSLLLFMMILEQYLRTQCDVEDPCGQIHPRTDPLPKYDFIVVGAGSAGSVVASRLSEVPEWKVLLIEAGVNEPVSSQVPSFWDNAFNTSVDWQYVTEPQSTAFLNNGGKALWHRGKVIGGTSTINTMVYIRGNRRDYDNWEAMGNPGWSYNDVLPYFIKSENNLEINTVDSGYHGVGGYMPISRYPFLYQFEADLIKGVRQMRQRIGDLNGESQLGFMVAQTTTQHGVRFSAARSFLRPVKNRNNLHIMLNTLVNKVIINVITKRAIGVEVTRRNGMREVIFSTKEVIVCAGAIGSPKILLQSGLGDRVSLSAVGIPVVHHLPGVGRNLHDHASFSVKFTTNQTNVNDLNWIEALKYLRFRDGTMSTTGDAIIGFIQTKYVNQREHYPDIRIQFGGYQAKCSKTGDIFESKDDVERGNMPTRQVTMRSIMVQPRSRGYLTLRDSNPLSCPKIFPRILSNPADIPPMIQGIRFLLSLSQTEALRKYDIALDRTPVKGCEGFLFGSDRYWECAIRRETLADNHQAGSCKMGPNNDPWAVVDPQLRVRGVSGLRVVDASIMPQVVAGNTHAPIVMIAEKASDLIKQRWLKYPFGFTQSKSSFVTSSQGL